MLAAETELDEFHYFLQENNISSEACIYNPRVITRFKNDGESVTDFVTRMTNSVYGQFFGLRKKGKRRTGSKASPSRWYGTTRQRSEVFLLTDRLAEGARDVPTRNIFRTVQLAMDLKVHPYVIALLCIRLDKKIFYQLSCPKRDRHVTYLYWCTKGQYAGLIKFGETIGTGKARMREYHHKFGGERLILEVPGNFQEKWKEDFKCYRHKFKESPEIFGPDVLGKLLPIYERVGIDGYASIDEPNQNTYLD